jgi:hypothetical protein
MNIKHIIGGIVGLILTIAIIYGCYWVAKTVSYKIFYEDMVKQTIREMVHTDLINGLQ